MSLSVHTRGRTSSGKANSASGFTLVEVMISLVLFVFLAMGALGTTTMMHEIARRQATYNSVLALVVSEQDSVRALPYTPPDAPFIAFKHETKQRKSVSLNAEGNKYMVDVALMTVFEPISTGHKVTVTASYHLNGDSPVISTTTLINEHSSVER